MIWLASKAGALLAAAPLPETGAIAGAETFAVATGATASLGAGAGVTGLGAAGTVTVVSGTGEEADVAISGAELASVVIESDGARTSSARERARSRCESTCTVPR